MRPRPVLAFGADPAEQAYGSLKEPRDCFARLAMQMAQQPLHEIGPAEPGAEAAAFGFALALAAGWGGQLVWAAEDGAFAEAGAPYPPGLAQFGLDRVLLVRAAKREDALWAAEQALALPGAVVLCTLAPSRKPLDLKASRRLLLLAEKRRARCLLVKREDGPSAAWTRWRVAPAPSQAHARELGATAFDAELTRHRAGPAGMRFTLIWDARAHAFAAPDPRAIAKGRGHE